MGFFKLLFSFAPWLAFLIIAPGSLLRLKIGLIVALTLSIIMGFTKLHRGVILWTGLAFFIAANVGVVGFESKWVIQYIGILASGAIALSTWVTMALGHPFTLDYARAHTAPSNWDKPIFIRTNYIITCVWGAVFTLNALFAFGKIHKLLLSTLNYGLLSHGLLISAVFFTSWYPKNVKNRYTRS